MRQPRKAVTGNKTEKEEPPLSDRDQVDDQGDAQRRADQVKHTGSGPAVFRQVKRPELRKRFVALLGHGSTARFSSTCFTRLMPMSAVVSPGVARANSIAICGSMRPCNNDALATTVTPNLFAASTTGTHS